MVLLIIPLYLFDFFFNIIIGTAWTASIILTDNKRTQLVTSVDSPLLYMFWHWKKIVLMCTTVSGGMRAGVHVLQQDEVFSMDQASAAAVMFSLFRKLQTWLNRLATRVCTGTQFTISILLGVCTHTCTQRFGFLYDDIFDCHTGGVSGSVCWTDMFDWSSCAGGVPWL